MRYEVANAQHIGMREEQQDAFGFIKPEDPKVVGHAGILGVLSDGMGGLQHGSAVARLGVETFLDAYRRKDPAESISRALERSLLEANAAVIRLAREFKAEGAAAATVVAAVIRGGELYWISAGDSRAYLVRQRHAYRITADHNYRADLAVYGASSNEPDGGPDPEAVTSFLGLPTDPRIDTNWRPIRLGPDDCVLLVSDGLYRTLTDDEIGMAQGQDLREMCQSLVDLVVQRGVEDQDNVTVMAMGVERDGKRQERWRRKR